jgi:hypothetical protein
MGLDSDTPEFLEWKPNEQFSGMRDLVARLDAFIAEKTTDCPVDPYRVLARLCATESTHLANAEAAF